MAIRVRDPLAEINRPPEGKRLRVLEAIEGRRMGLLWSQHASSVNFWPVLERIAEARFRPSEVHRLYKRSTWNPASAAEIAAFAQQVDYALVGVGG
ncbi:MAG: hypothetical protein HY691_08880 [Chloroflexi bacterium]|nr:hypothetical protein [Chloroflexota bacterium]